MRVIEKSLEILWQYGKNKHKIVFIISHFFKCFEMNSCKHGVSCILHLYSYTVDRYHSSNYLQKQGQKLSKCKSRLSLGKTIFDVFFFIHKLLKLKKLLYVTPEKFASSQCYHTYQSWIINLCTRKNLAKILMSLM